MNASKAVRRAITVLVAGAILILAGWVWWLCRYDNRTPFLPGDPAAEWVLYPKPPDANPHKAMPIWAVFRRTFPLMSLPAKATLTARAFREGVVSINGHRLVELGLAERDWKRRHQVEVAALLRVGENEISVTITNSLGPPALWLALEGEGLTLRSGAAWQVSLIGAAEQPAVPASASPPIRAGSRLYGRELMAQSLGRIWPGLLLIVLISAAVVLGGGWCFRRESAAKVAPSAGAGKMNYLAPAPQTVLLLIIVSWVVLFSNNLPQIAPLFGFDRDGHQEYIDYILQKKGLPLASDGWQMYQPPLYYLMSALAITPFGWSASADEAVLLLRVCSVFIGIGNLVLVYLCLRLIFPGRPWPQVVGLLLAGFLPANLCLTHHVTNEGLAALFVTAALYFTLRSAREERPSVRSALAVGVCLGLAMLTKFSALLAIPFVLVALTWPHKNWEGVKGPAMRVSSALMSLLIVCGWHFGRVWHRFGTPLIGNWDPRLPFAWWQDPGCHTSGWYVRFGQALIRPLFSSLSSFADGVYVTLWGDGLGSGSSWMDFRPPWNYDLMNVSFLLSMLTTALLVIGAIVALIRFVRQPTADWFLILGMVFAFGAGIGLMTLQVASYAQVKAFYALPALFPLCALAVVGWELLERKCGSWRLLLRVGLLTWAITVYTSFWIRSGAAVTYTVRGLNLADDQRYREAAERFSQALQRDTSSLVARVGLAEAWRQLGRREEGRQQAELALRQHPDEAEAHIEVAAFRALDRRYDEAVQHLREAAARAPDHPTVYQRLAACLTEMGQQKQAIEACAQGLRVNPFRPELHQMLGAAAAGAGDLTNALVHLHLALGLKPNYPEARRTLALTLASLGRLDEAIDQCQQAIRSKPDDAKLRQLFAVLLTTQGNYEGAVEQYYEVLRLQPDHIEALNNLAWILAANANPQIRNGEEAVRLAERACGLTQRREAVLLGTLAAAYAEAGRFRDATATAEAAQQVAVAAGQKEIAERNHELIELYRASRAYHEPSRASH